MRSLWTFGLAMTVAGSLWTGKLCAQQAAASTERQSLLGVWQLKSAKDYRPDGEALDWIGATPSGTIIYTANGRMAVQFVRDPRATFAGSSMWSSDGRELLPGASAGEIRDAYAGYYAYFGTWQIDERAHTITHHVEASLRPEEVGRNYVRPYELSGEQVLFRYPVLAADGERRTRVIVFTRAERF
jgi:hypothetical protein